MLKRRVPFWFPVLLLVIVSSVFLVIIQGRDRSGGEEDIPAAAFFDSDSENEQSFWRERIETIGVKQAYSEFKKINATRSFGVQHAHAHMIGELLYQTEGLGGVTICDSSFSFGCYHSFFRKALAEHGIHVVSDLDKACVKTHGPLGTGCQHGVGHGILEFFGHNQLVKSLEACKFTTSVSDIFGCSSGVFMEYNIPLIVDGERIYSNIRPLNPNNPYDPCNTVIPERFKKSCYYEIAEWWSHVYSKDFTKIGKLCAGIPNKSYQEQCYFGVGNIIVPSRAFDVDAIIQTCATMPDFYGEFGCRTGAAWGFRSLPHRKFQSPRLCEGLSEAHEKKCLEESDLIGERKFNEGGGNK